MKNFKKFEKEYRNRLNTESYIWLTHLRGSCCRFAIR